MILEIDALDAEGRGVARNAGKVVFVEGAITGERVEARLLESRSKFDRARVSAVLRASASRREPSTCIATSSTMSERPQLCVGAVVLSAGRLLLVQRATSPGRGLRVVQDTEKPTPGRRRIRACRRLVLPAPEGAAIT